MRINVAGQSWELREFDPVSRADSSMGRSDSKLGIIHIAKDLPTDIREATLVHEWIHGLLDAYGVGHDEAVVNVIANELFRYGFCAPLEENAGEGL